MCHWLNNIFLIVFLPSFFPKINYKIKYFLFRPLWKVTPHWNGVLPPGVAKQWGYHQTCYPHCMSLLKQAHLRKQNLWLWTVAMVTSSAGKSIIYTVHYSISRVGNMILIVFTIWASDFKNCIIQKSAILLTYVRITHSLAYFYYIDHWSPPPPPTLFFVRTGGCIVLCSRCRDWYVQGLKTQGVPLI